MALAVDYWLKVNNNMLLARTWYIQILILDWDNCASYDIYYDGNYKYVDRDL